MRIEGCAGPVLIAPAFALAGVVAGAATRLVLGRLRRGARIRIGWCEALLGLLWCATGAAWASGPLSGSGLPLLLGLGWLVVAAGSVDVVQLRLPDVLTLPAIPAGVLLLVPMGSAAVWRGIAGGAVALSAYAAVHLLAPGALGAGDVKLAGSLGAALTGVSWPALVLAAVLAAVLSAVVALGLGQAVVPHGASMLGAAWLVAAGPVVAGAPLGVGGGG
jgi:leader peptidase (prepilin peptidase)/N-methyltransferase